MPDRANHGRIRVWDAPLRLFHWLLVAFVAVAFISSDEDSPWASWHQAAGWIVALLIAFRLVWGVVGGENARFAAFVRPGEIGRHISGLVRGSPRPSLGHSALGGLSALTLIGLTAATVVTGALLASRNNEGLHETIAYALLVFVAIHVVAVVAMSALTRENLVRAFVVGSKPAALHPGAADARPPSAFAYALAAAVIAVTVYGITQIDPHAFSSQPKREEAENKGSQ
jgi:cytochrome b